MIVVDAVDAGVAVPIVSVVVESVSVALAVLDVFASVVLVAVKDDTDDVV